MSCWRWNFVSVCLVLPALAACPRLVQGAGISLNFAADINAATVIGSNSAGQAYFGSWNDIPLAQQTNLALQDSTGTTVPGLTLTTAEAFAFPGSAFDASASNFTHPGSTSLMRGHIYHAGGSPVDLAFSGAVPYSTYDLYIYYNSGGIANSQTFSILDSSGASLGWSQVGAEVPGGDTGYVLSDGLGNDANYVKFSGLTSATVPPNFILRAQGDAGGFGYFNGVQFAEAGAPTPPLPPPPSQVTDKFPAISVNLASDVLDVTAVGANAAGVARSTNWNDIPLAQQTNTPLKSNSGSVVPGLTLSTDETFVVPASAVDSGASFADAGNRALMGGHIYHGGGASVDVRVDGTIPFEEYDLYVYFNSGAVPNTQILSLLASDLSDIGLSATVSEIPGSDSAFSEAIDATVNSNYVKFAGLNNIDLPSFVLRAQNAGTASSNQYGYINGFQIVSTVPEPSSMLLVACGSALALSLRRRD